MRRVKILLFLGLNDTSILQTQMLRHISVVELCHSSSIVSYGQDSSKAKANKL